LKEQKEEEKKLRYVNQTALLSIFLIPQTISRGARRKLRELIKENRSERDEIKEKLSSLDPNTKRARNLQQEMKLCEERIFDLRNQLRAINPKHKSPSKVGGKKQNNLKREESLLVRLGKKLKQIN